MHSPDIFAELSLVLVIVALVAGVMRLLRQPLILGYILTGIIVGPLLFNIVHAKEAFEGFSQIGIALLLFIIGLGMNLNVIKSLGKVSLAAASAILLVVGGLGAVASWQLGYSLATAIIIALALFFSSTIIILKVLSDKRQTNRLHGQIAIGVVILDDVVATVAILFVAALGQSGSLGGSEVGLLVAKALGIGGALYLVSSKIIPLLAKSLAKSQELLFLFAIAWAFGVAQAFSFAGFSHEVGALFAGVSLAGLPYAAEMAARLKPLRDFFIVLFFVYLGERFVFDNFLGVLIPALVLSAIVLIGKPLVVMASLGALKYTKLTSFKVAVHLSQISEFSIVLVVFAASLNVIDPSAVSVITLVALITIAVSSYLMKYDDQLYKKMIGLLGKFERKGARERPQKRELYTAILFGYHGGGHEFLKLFREMKHHYLVVDYDPEIIEHLEVQGVRHAYGDATDTEFLDDINAGSARLVASIFTDRGMNKLLLNYLQKRNKNLVFICHAVSYEDAIELYSHGAAYVILPKFVGSEKITSHIKKHGLNKDSFTRFRQKHIVSIGKQATGIIHRS